MKLFEGAKEMILYYYYAESLEEAKKLSGIESMTETTYEEYKKWKEIFCGEPPNTILREDFKGQLDSFVYL
jgi:hypothetical protein